MSKSGFYGLLIVSTLAICGCATTAPKEVDLYWPLPPEEPRIAYLKSYKGEGDFRKSGFFDAIFGAPSATRLQKPYGVFARGEKIYVTVAGSSVVAIFDLKEQKVTYLGDSGSGKLSLPLGIAVTADNRIFVSDGKLKRVFAYDEKGNIKLAIGKKDEFKNPSGIAINEELGRLYVADSYMHSVLVYSLKGEPLFQFGGRGYKDGEFNYPTNVAVDKRNGNVYVVDTQNFKVQVFDKDGKFIRKFGEVGDKPGNFARPKGIGIDSEGHVYVADAAFDNVQIFDENGQLLLFIGSAGEDPGYFQLPAGIYVDAKDKVYVVDSLNGRIQVFQYLSEKWKKENPDELKKYQLK